MTIQISNTDSVGVRIVVAQIPDDMCGHQAHVASILTAQLVPLLCIRMLVKHRGRGSIIQEEYDLIVCCCSRSLATC